VWFAQFHDPWAYAPDRSWSWSKIGQWEQALERKIVEHCDRVVCATEESTEAFADRYGTRQRFFTVHNGYDPVDFPDVGRCGISDGPTVFTHAGTLYANRDPTALISALTNLINSGQLSRNDIRIRLMGHNEWEYTNSIPALVEKHQLNEVVEFLPTVDYTKALQMLAQSHVLLLLAEGQPTQIPAKAFEYLHLGRPVLAIATGATARLITETNTGIVVTSDNVSAIEAALLCMTKGNAKGTRTTINDNKKNQYRADVLASKLAAELDASIDEPAARRRPLRVKSNSMT
jgi:glycosyltransferase involved in cell wall biosynthesis